MTHAPAGTLRLCPECGGILQPTRPAWVTAIDLAVAAIPQEAPPARWLCLICGYYEPQAPPAAEPV